MNELKVSRLIAIIHATSGIAYGWLSPLLAKIFSTNWVPFGIGILLLFALGYACERMIGKRGFGFWFGNGGIIYLFMWFIFWVFFYNLGV